MGCGFACVVPAEHEAAAVALLAGRHPGAARIGTVTADAGHVSLPRLGLGGTRGAGLSQGSDGPPAA